MVTCGVCGETANPGSIFCRRCGAELPRRGVPISDAQTTVLPTIPPEQPGQAEQSAPDERSSGPEQAPPRHQAPQPGYEQPGYEPPAAPLSYGRPPAHGADPNVPANPFQVNQPTESYAATQPPSQYQQAQYQQPQYQPTQYQPNQYQQPQAPRPAYLPPADRATDYEPAPVFLPSDQRPPNRPRNRNGTIAAIIGGVLVLVLVAFGIAIVLLSKDNSKSGVAQPVPTTTPFSSKPSAPSSSAKPSTSAKPTPTPTPKPSVNKTKVAQTAAMKNLGALVGSSGSARAGIGAALSEIGSCKSIPAAVTTLKNAANTRLRLSTQAGSINVSTIPTGAALIGAFQNSMKQSALADQRYAAWGARVQGCKKKAPSNNALKAALGYDGQATAAKTDFANKYNAVAKTLGLPGTDASSF